MKLTRLVDFRKHKFDVYIGRMELRCAPAPSSVLCVFSNPFCWKELGRKTAFRRYAKYFNRRIKTDLGFRAALETIRGKRLGCSCKTPDLCHGKIIIRYLNGAVE